MAQANTNNLNAKQTTPASLRALLAGIIDYAGLFPPAALELPAVVKNYSAYLASDDAWMLGRLIVPAAKLGEFQTLAARLLPMDDAADPWRISALVKSAAESDVVPAMDIIRSFNEKHEDASNGLAVVETIELPAESAEHIDAALDNIPDEIFPFFEFPVENDPRGLIATLAGSDAGAKIRTGGTTPDLYPKPQEIARFLSSCIAANAPFKATAGLHHPLRHRNRSVGADEFGFLNVFLAACLIACDAVDDDAVIDVLTEQSIDAFRFDDGGAEWRESRVAIEEIEDCRAELAISFGSCSFDEPREDLRELKLLA